MELALHAHIRNV